MSEGSGIDKVILLAVLLIAMAIIVTLILIPAYVHFGANNAPGYYNTLYLSKYSPYRTIVVEVDYQTGMEPDPTSIEILKQQIELYSGKSVVIHVNQDIENDEVPLIINGKNIFNIASRLQRAHRDQRTGWLGGNITLNVMYLDTAWLPDNLVSNSMPATDNIYPVGVTYAADSIIIFKGSFLNEDLRTTILLHELGHVWGLDHSNESDNVMKAQFNVFCNTSAHTVHSQFPIDFSQQDKDKLARVHMSPYFIPLF